MRNGQAVLAVSQKSANATTPNPTAVSSVDTDTKDTLRHDATLRSNYIPSDGTEPLPRVSSAAANSYILVLIIPNQNSHSRSEINIFSSAFSLTIGVICSHGGFPGVPRVVCLEKQEGPALDICLLPTSPPSLPCSLLSQF